ncbi:MAG: glycosyltransferase [Micromonosporaceae bacterium]|nr:glycosyltransferase [Micromonosporaceae bacterium]
MVPARNRTARPDRRRVVPPPILLPAVIVIVLLANVLLIESYVDARFAPDGEAQSSHTQRTVPASVLDGGPIIDARGGQLHSYRMPPKTVALTFDDGPDPQWTPQILKVLRDNGVPATFFVVGSLVARHPDIVRELVAQGHEIGVHTFTHPVLSQLPAWRRRLEYSQTQLAIRYAAGVDPVLLRLPYSAGVDSLDDTTWPEVPEAGRLGYILAFQDVDSQDWTRPGVNAVIRNATPTDAGGVVLLHDAGGDRSQTVLALAKLIPLLKARGFRFVTVSEGIREAQTGGQAPAGIRAAPVGPEHVGAAPGSWRGAALVWAVQLAGRAVSLLWMVLLAVGLLTIGRTGLLFVFAVRHARRRRNPDWSWGPPVTEPVSVIVPAYNEKEGIVPAVRSLAGGDHPTEVVVVDDASTDGTAELVEDLALPNVRVVRVPPGGKATALNAGLAMSVCDIVVMVDADTVVEPDAIHNLVQPFADPGVGAVAGNVKVGNRRSIWARWQHIEYVVGFNVDRRLYDTLRCMPTVPGALGGFRRQAVADAGGVTDETLAEDTDLTIAVQRAGWRVVYEETARAWTEAPATLRQLWLQRYRWSYGTMQAFWKHRRALRAPGSGFSPFGLPLLMLYTVLLPLVAPVIDILTLYSVVALNQLAALVAWLAVLAVQLATALLAFRLDRERYRPLWMLPLQQFVYRQLMYLVLLQSAVTAVTGGRLRWHKLRRTGEAAASAPHLSGP